MTAAELIIAETFIGLYGQGLTRGLISEHVEEFLAKGGRIRTTTSGRPWAVLEDGRAFPILCSEVIQVETEDGPASGRCGLLATHELGMCDRHGGAMASFREMCDVEVAAWEREIDAEWERSI